MYLHDVYFAFHFRVSPYSFFPGGMRQFGRVSLDSDAEVFAFPRAWIGIHNVGCDGAEAERKWAWQKEKPRIERFIPKGFECKSHKIEVGK